MLREPTLEELAREIATECRPDCCLSLSCSCPRPPQRPRDARPIDEIEPAYCEKIEQLVLGALHRAVKVEREKIAQWIGERSWVRAEVCQPFTDANFMEPLGRLLSSIREDFADVVRAGHYDFSNLHTLDGVRIDLPGFSSLGASGDWRAHISQELREEWPEMTHEERADQAIWAARVPLKKVCSPHSAS